MGWLFDEEALILVQGSGCGEMYALFGKEATLQELEPPLSLNGGPACATSAEISTPSCNYVHVLPAPFGSGVDRWSVYVSEASLWEKGRLRAGGRL